MECGCSPFDALAHAAHLAAEAALDGSAEADLAAVEAVEAEIEPVLTAAEALEAGILSPGAVADALSEGHSPEELGLELEAAE